MTYYPYPYPEVGPESDYVPDTDEVETAFHEYASRLEMAEPGTYPDAPEFAFWKEAMWGFRRWHAEEIRKAKEEAWADGHDAGWESRNDDATAGWVPSGVHESDAENPYRKENE